MTPLGWLIPCVLRCEGAGGDQISVQLLASAASLADNPRETPAIENPPPRLSAETFTTSTAETLHRLRRVLNAQRGVAGRERLRVAVKRSIDVVVSLLMLLSVLPIGLLIALAIKLDSPGPVFYRARRVGHRGRPMEMLKFRKMRHDAAGPALTADDDGRFTRVGAWLAKLKLDELPQLWNVLRGDMSLIGPRPEDPHFVAIHPEEFLDVLRMRPGMTGLSQIAFADESRILDDDDPTAHYVARILPQKLSLDRLYSTEYKLRIDVLILVWTLVAVMMRRQVAVHRQTGRMNVRRRRKPDERRLTVAAERHVPEDSRVRGEPVAARR